MCNEDILPFWKRNKTTELTRDEWEFLCDGCSKCCLHKIEDEETGNVYYTRIVCRYMNMNTCRCTKYELRTRLVGNCLKLSPDNIKKIKWLPKTCAYRLVAEGKDLKWWHPLVSGSKNSVHEAGISVRGKVLSEIYVHPDGWDEHVIDWVDQTEGQRHPSTSSGQAVGQLIVGAALAANIEGAGIEGHRIRGLRIKEVRR